MKRTFELTLTFVFLYLMIVSVLAQNPQDFFKSGNDFYQNGQYEEAVESYKKVVNLELESSELFFNLGNAYYKKGDIANSILYYEKALLLSPDDEDIVYNLKIANQLVVDKISPKPEFFIESWWKSFSAIFSVRIWSVMLVIFNFLLFFSISVFVLTKSAVLKKLTFTFFIIFLIGVGISFFATNRMYNEVATQKFAIVFTSNAYVKSSPDDKSTDLFVLHQGTKLKLLDEIGDWYQIEIADGNKGWFKKESLQAI